MLVPPTFLGLMKMNLWRWEMIMTLRGRREAPEVARDYSSAEAPVAS